MDTTLAMDAKTLELFVSLDNNQYHLYAVDFSVKRLGEVFRRELEGMSVQITSLGSVENGRTMKGSDLSLYAESVVSSHVDRQPTQNITVKLTAPGSNQEIMSHGTMPDGTMHMTFASAEFLGRVVGEILHDFLAHVARMHLAVPNHKSSNQLIGMALGKGFTAQTARDILIKDRTYEITLHVGKTRWSPPPSPMDDDDGADKILIYYDRTSGVWEILH